MPTSCSKPRKPPLTASMRKSRGTQTTWGGQCCGPAPLQSTACMSTPERTSPRSRRRLGFEPGNIGSQERNQDFHCLLRPLFHEPMSGVFQGDLGDGGAHKLHLRAEN